MISENEVRMAIAARLPASAWRLWHYVGIKVSGNPDGWRIGIKELERGTGLSPPTLWRAAGQLDAAGLVHKKRDGVNRWVLCDGFCKACRSK